MKEDIEHKLSPIKKQKRLTVSELRNFKGLDHLSEDEAESAISTLEKFSLLMFEMYKKEKALKESLKAMDNKE
jgi:hypothetical protein